MHIDKVVQNLDLASITPGSIVRLGVELSANALGGHYVLPVIVAKGIEEGPILGVTAMIHGNEVNGMPVVHKLFRDLNVQELQGIIIGVPIANLAGYMLNSRFFSDGKDLNTLMPGREKGTESELYAYHFMHKIAVHFQYHIDLHTASFGRVNSLYVRADLEHEVTQKMAYLQHPQIILHNAGKGGTLRHACMDLGIPSITVEVGNPLVLQSHLIDESLKGIYHVMSYLKMLNKTPKFSNPSQPVICSSSDWIYADDGGVLEVTKKITDVVKGGEVIAKLFTTFGDLKKEYRAPEDGIVVGCSTNPICHSGSRVLHLGKMVSNISQVSQGISQKFGQ